MVAKSLAKKYLGGFDHHLEENQLQVKMSFFQIIAAGEKCTNTKTILHTFNHSQHVSSFVPPIKRWEEEKGGRWAKEEEGAKVGGRKREEAGGRGRREGGVWVCEDMRMDVRGYAYWCTTIRVWMCEDTSVRVFDTRIGEKGGRETDR